MDLHRTHAAYGSGDVAHGCPGFARLPGGSEWEYRGVERDCRPIGALHFSPHCLLECGDLPIRAVALVARGLRDRARPALGITPVFGFLTKDVSACQSAEPSRRVHERA